LVGYLSSGWINGLVPGSVEAGSVNGIPAAFASAATSGYSYRIAVMRLGDNAYRFLFATRTPSAAFETAFTATIGSFDALSVQERAGLRPLTIAIVTVRPGDTVESLAAGMAAGLDRPTQLLRALNGLS